MMRFASRHLTPLLPAMLLLAALLAPATASAHEQRVIGGGKYNAVVGWDVEPAFAGQKNAAAIRITQAGTNPAVPVEGLAQTLKVRIRQGAETREFPLRSVFGQPGYYVADIVPTRAGDYQWTFTGTIGDEPINEVFDTADGKFNAVAPITELQFPLAVGGPAEQAQLAAAVREARATAQTAQLIAIAGVVVGLLGLAAAGTAWMSRRRAPATTTTRPAAERA